MLCDLSEFGPDSLSRPVVELREFFPRGELQVRVFGEYDDVSVARSESIRIRLNDSHVVVGFVRSSYSGRIVSESRTARHASPTAVAKSEVFSCHVFRT